MDGSKDQKPNGKTGFSGLSDLTSDIDDVLRSADRVASAGGANKSQLIPPATPQSYPNTGSASSPTGSPARPPSRVPLKLLVGLVVLGAVFWGVVANNSKSPPAISSGGSASSTGGSDAINFDDLVQQKPGGTTSTGKAAESSPPVVQSPAEPARPSEEQPRVGTDLVLGVSEIRYCLAEEIRMEGAKAIADAYNGAEVDKFNSIVHDYNSRCGSFRYRSGDMERAKGDIEPFRSEYLAEGKSRLRPQSAKASGSSSASSPASAAPTNLCKARPKNGKILKKNVRFVENGHRLTIENGSSSDAIVKLRDAMDGRLAASFYVKKSMTASLNGIPDGQYRVQFAYGDAMTRDCTAFINPVASAFNGIQSLATETTASQIITQEISFTLFTVTGGNVRPVGISPEEFNGD